MEKKIIKDEDGVEHEVYDANDVDAEVISKETAFASEKDKLAADLKDKEDALAKSNEKAGDFQSLRTAKEVAEKALRDATDKHAQEISDLRNVNVKEAKDKLFNLIVGGDKNLEEKMKFHLDSTLKAMPEGTKEEIDAKYKAAYTLAAGHSEDDKISNIISSAGGSEFGGKANVSSDLREVGKKFGLTDKDWDAAKQAGLPVE